jgi:predicted DNA-binding protein with PD1-like motif
MKPKVLGPGSWLLVLDKGEELIYALTDFAKEKEISFASVSGIGAASNVTIAIFSSADRKYIERTFSGDLELVSLMGNITKLETENPKLHLHAVIAGDDLSAHAGHLISAQISITGELIINTYPEKIERKLDEETGLMLIG